jgi:hypothetical protein
LPVRKRNIVKIKVQRKISFAFAIAAIAILLLLTFCGIYFIYSSKISTSHRTNDEAYAAVLLVFALIPLLFKEGAGRQKYVSDIIVTNYSLQIIYRIKSKIVELKEFAVGEIKSIETVLNIKLHKEKNNIQSESNTKTTIMLKDGNSLFFDAQPSIITGKHYAFLFSMIKNRAMLPNFSYRLNISDDNIDGENKAINYKIFNDYVEYYSKHLRPQLFLKPMTFSNREFWFLMAVFIPLVILVACVIFMELRHLSLENIKDFFNIAAWKEFFKNP